MPKRVLDIGNCVPDHTALRALIEGQFGAVLDRAHQWQDAEAQLRSATYDLVLVNRKLDVDYTDGLDIIHKLQADAALRQVPVMMITNYADHQATAVAAGALEGFGKLELGAPATREKLSAVLGQPVGK